MAYNSVSREVTGGITWIELVMDCELATRVKFVHHSKRKKLPGNPTSLRERANFFCCATRQLFRICGGPRLPKGKAGSLHAFGGVPSAGLPIRPALCSPEHIFAELAHQGLIHRKKLNGREDSANHWSWPPFYLRPPKQVWNNAAVDLGLRPTNRLRRKTCLTLEPA